MLPLLAQAEPSQFVTIGILIIGGGAVMQFLVGWLTVSRLTSGKANERQIEPTQLAAIQSEMRMQTMTLNKLDREMGVASANISAVDKKVDQLATDQKRETENVFRRINAISTESSITAKRLDDHLADHRDEKKS